MKRALISLSAVALTGGCVAGADYAPRVEAIPSAFKDATGEAGHAGPWWRTFGDPLLDSLVERAMADNQDVAAALARVEQARAAAGVARAARYPGGVIDGSAASTRQSTEFGLGRLSAYVPEIERVQESYELTAGASWELDLAGGLRRGREAATAEWQAAQATSAATRVTIAAEVVDAYVSLRTLQSRRMVAIRQIEAASRLEEMVRVRLEVRTASLREYEQARAATSATRASLPGLDIAIERQMNRLFVLVGTFPQADRGVLAETAPLRAAALGDLGAPTDLVRRRPDLLAAERRIAASHARIGVALAEYYPRISLLGLAGFQSNQAGTLFTEPANVVQAVVGLRWRIFDFARLDAAVAQARGAEREALATHRGLLLRAAEEVENAIAAYHGEARRKAEHENEVASAREARRLSELAWQARQISLIEVIEADRRLLAAEDQLTIAEGERLRAIIAAHRATGG